MRDRIEVAGRTLLARAQQAGAVRPDLVYEDVIVLFWSLRGVIEATSAVSPEAWLRHLDLLVTSLAPDGPPLRHPPLTAGRCGRPGRPWPSVPRSGAPGGAGPDPAGAGSTGTAAHGPAGAYTSARWRSCRERAISRMP